VSLVVVNHAQPPDVPLGELDPWPVLFDASERLAWRPTWVGAGTALGLLRDGGFIPHDTDIDFETWGVWGSPPDIASLFRGWTPIRTMTFLDHPMQVAVAKDDILVDVYLFYEGVLPGHLVNVNEFGTFRPDRDMILPAAECWYSDECVPAPRDAERYLAWRFGPDWRTPKTSKGQWNEDAAGLEGPLKPHEIPKPHGTPRIPFDVA